MTGNTSWHQVLYSSTLLDKELLMKRADEKLCQLLFKYGDFMKYFDAPFRICFFMRLFFFSLNNISIWYEQQVRNYIISPVFLLSLEKLVPLLKEISPSLVPEKCRRNFASVLFKLILRIDILETSYEIGLRWVPQNPTEYKSTLAQVMAWYRQATSHYLSQCR